jgi:hypothetical protein
VGDLRWEVTGDADILKDVRVLLNVNGVGGDGEAKDTEQLNSESLLVRLEANEKEAFRDAAELAGVPLSVFGFARGLGGSRSESFRKQRDQSRCFDGELAFDSQPIIPHAPSKC